MDGSRRFEAASMRLARIIERSAAPEDPSHAENTLHWMLQLAPTADEILQLAAYGHDTERALADRLHQDSFETYDKYKCAHARRSGRVVARIALECGYTRAESNRLAYLIGAGEFASDDPDVQLLCDADSISFFDNNLPYYLEGKGVERTRTKIEFMYGRASIRAREHVRELLRSKPELNLLAL
jgi:hypothetical protein